MSRHVSAETLARRQEGVMSVRKAARIDAHLSGCALCSGTLADLAAVSALLVTTQLPAMPEVLAQRILMAIADESAARAAATAEPGAQARAAAGSPASASWDDAAASRAGERTTIPGRPDLPDRPRRARQSRRFRLPSMTSPLVLRGLAATAAVVVIAGVGFVLANGNGQSGSGETAHGAAKPRAAKNLPTAAGGNASYAPSSRARQASHASPVSVHYRLNGKVAQTTAVVTRTNFRRKSLATLLHKDLRQTPPNSAGPPAPSAAPTATSTAYGFDIPQIEGCLSRINSGREVLLAAVARFLGKPATIIVLKSVTSAAILDVAIVGPACSASNPHVIFQTTIPVG